MSILTSLPLNKINNFCRRHKIKRLLLFGSAIRDDFNDESDIDLLVEFEQNADVGLEFFDMEIELSEILGRKVDLNTPGFLSSYFREEVINSSETVYEQS